MALINRIARLLRADFHAILDQVEEPEQLLRQAIREMEDELGEAEQQIKLYEHEQEVLARRTRDLVATIENIEPQLDLCFASGEEDLARKLIKKKLEAGRLLKRIEARREANEEFLTEKRGLVAEHHATLESLRQKAEIYAQRPVMPGSGSVDPDDARWMAEDAAVAAEDVEIAFLHEKNLRSAS